MDIHKHDQYTTRDAILKLLSDAEIARVSTAETARRLADGEEYLDLQHLDQGVIHASGSATGGVSPASSSSAPPMHQILPKKAVSADTWKKILTHLAPPSVVRKL